MASGPRSLDDLSAAGAAAIIKIELAEAEFVRRGLPGVLRFECPVVFHVIAVTVDGEFRKCPSSYRAIRRREEQRDERDAFKKFSMPAA